MWLRVENILNYYTRSVSETNCLSTLFEKVAKKGE